MPGYTFCTAVLTIIRFEHSVERCECDSLDCVGKYFASKEGDGSTVYEGLRGALMCMSMSLLAGRTITDHRGCRANYPVKRTAARQGGSIRAQLLCTALIT